MPMQGGGPGLPDNLIQDQSAFELPRESRTQGLVDATVDGFDHSILVPTSQLLAKELIKYTDPGKLMTSAEFDDSTYKRPGLNHPDGVYENEAILASQIYDGNAIRKENLSILPKGPLTDVSNFTAETLGQVLDPIALLGGEVTATAVGLKSAAIAAKASRLIGDSGLAELAPNVVRGGAIGAAIGIPQSVVNYANQRTSGEDTSILDFADNLAWNVGLGVGIDTGLGAIFRTVTPEAHMAALNTSNNQVLDGRKVNIEPILKKGFNAQRDIDASEGIQDKLDDNITSHNTSIDKLNNEIGNHQKELSDMNIDKGKIDNYMDNSTSIHTHRLKSIFSKPEFSRTPDDIKYVDDIPKTSEANKLISVLSKNTHERTVEDQSFVNHMSNDNESKISKDNLDQKQSEFDKISPEKKQLDILDKSKKSKIDNLSSELENAKAKHEKIKSFDELPKKSRSLMHSIEKKKALIQTLSHHKNVSGFLKDVSDYRFPEDTGDSIKDISDKQASYESISDYDKNENNEFQKHLENAREDNKDLLDNIDELLNNVKGDLDENILNDLNETEDNNNKISSAIKDFIDCISGGGENG